MEKINLTKLLKDCPKGMELDCTMFDNLVFSEVYLEASDYPIVATLPNGVQKWFTPDGRYEDNPNAKCVIFPKDKKTWEGFHRPFVDGDVVAFDNPNRNHLQIFIFKDKKENNTLSNCYLMLDGDELDLEEGMYYVTRFATEEEKQKLFQAIKDNGYEWNSETMTLEKLIKPKFKVGDRIKNSNNHHSSTVAEIKDDCFIIKTLDGLGHSYLTDKLPFSKQNEYELVADKFNINTLKPFDRVLVRGNVGQRWTIDFFGFMDNNKGCPFVCVGHYVTQCIPYEGNEFLLGTTDNCDEFYKNWND